MLTKTIMRLKSISPGLERAVMNWWYDAVASWFQQPQWTFMNFGYEGTNGEPPLALEPCEEPDRYSIQLYHHAASAVGLEGKDALEVGSGRGGGAAWLTRRHRPRSMVGMDYSPNAVRLCRRLHAVDGLEFRHGDSQAMPFADASFDVVVNIESSHGYARMDSFLGEVHRVLRPGGHFTWVDFRPAVQVPAVEACFAASGLRPVRSLDITAEVLRALDLAQERKLELIRRNAPPIVRGLLNEFAAVSGSDSYDGLAARRMVYLSRTLRKA